MCENPAEISLAENEIRQAMHPADQFDAFKALADQKMSDEDIAARFGVTVQVVRQRLKLARVSPKLIALYRKGEMPLDCLMAFAISDDHKQQEKIWKDLPEWSKERCRQHPRYAHRGAYRCRQQAGAFRHRRGL